MHKYKKESEKSAHQYKSKQTQKLSLLFALTLLCRVCAVLASNYSAAEDQTDLPTSAEQQTLTTRAMD